ncbi:MAG: ornithine carbamoyltransferase [Chloroherpetonaceae bacterium]|nr:ornithine carbamoyltransferase [Chloroherpetonaceae bacterium]
MNHELMNDLLSLENLSYNKIEEIFIKAEELKFNKNERPLIGKTAAMIFQKPSLRTRVSFEVGVFQLGGHPVYLGQESVGLGTRESVADVARVLSRYNDLIIARLFDHNLLLDLAKWADIPVINALTNFSHPCQVLADAFTLRMKGKLKPDSKIVFIGDGNNIVHSWLEFAMNYPIHFVISTPKGYEPDQSLFNLAVKNTKGKIEWIENPIQAARYADALYTDVWVSMGQEKETEIRKKVFSTYQINQELLNNAKADALVLHCLPAVRGEEITDEVLDGSNSEVFLEAENRLHVQKAIMAMLYYAT